MDRVALIAHQNDKARALEAGCPITSWLAMNGVAMDRIALILGDSVAIVQKHYAHLSPDYLRNEMEGIG